MIRTYYAALNREDYTTAYALLSDERKRAVGSAAEWGESLRGTSYTNVTIDDIESDTMVATAQVSYQLLRSGRKGLFECQQVSLTRQISLDNGDPKLGTPAINSTRNCA